MFSESFLHFLLGKTDEEVNNKTEEVQTIPFRSFKVQEAAKVVVASIKDTF